MRKHRNKFIAAIIILVVLAVAYIYGGSYDKKTSAEAPKASTITEMSEAATIMETSSAVSESSSSTSTTNVLTTSESDASISVTESSSAVTELSSEASTIMETSSAVTESSSAVTESSSEASTIMESSSAVTDISISTESIANEMPAPVEPQDAAISEDSFNITFSIECSVLLNNLSMLNKDKHELVPADGVVLQETSVIAYEGESVFNILSRETRRAGIHMTFRSTPVFNSAYIEDINNIYEFDAGELSGWVYSVNGWFPGYGCSRYQLRAGDVVVFHYSCDLGRDLGEYLDNMQIDD